VKSTVKIKFLDYSMLIIYSMRPISREGVLDALYFRRSETLNLRLSLLLISVHLLAACSSQQVGSTVYGALGANECKEKTGGLACDLDERSTNERLINGSPDQHSTEALISQAEKIRKDNDKLTDSE
jgi:hypothetical protein